MNLSRRSCMTILTLTASWTCVGVWPRRESRARSSKQVFLRNCSSALRGRKTVLAGCRSCEEIFVYLFMVFFCVCLFGKERFRGWWYGGYFFLFLIHGYFIVMEVVIIFVIIVKMVIRFFGKKKKCYLLLWLFFSVSLLSTYIYC